MVSIESLEQRKIYSWINQYRNSNDDSWWISHGLQVSYDFTFLFGYEDSDFFLSLETEVWELENGNNKVITPALNRYYGGIGLYAVDFNFCSN